MVESTSEVNIMYRGFIIKVRASKESDGKKTVHTFINYHVPELKPEYAEQIDKRNVINTQDGEIECMRTYDTIGSRKAEALTEVEYYDPEYDETEDKSLISRLLSISSSDENSSPSLSTMIRDVIESVQDNIDNYIEAHSSCEISKDEVRHGLEQSLSKPINDIKVYNPSMNTNTLHDSVRPNISEIENKLEK